MKEKTGSKPTSEASFEEVYRTYYKGCMAFIASTFPKLREEEVEDICSDAMIRAFRSFKGYDPAKGGMTTWLFKIAVNAAKDHFSDCKKQPASITSSGKGRDDIEDVYELDIIDTDSKTPIEVILEEEREEKKNENIEKLEEIEKEIVLMRDQGVKYSEISEKLGIPSATCRTKFRRATQKLRKIMNASDEAID